METEMKCYQINGIVTQRTTGTTDAIQHLLDRRMLSFRTREQAKKNKKRIRRLFEKTYHIQRMWVEKNLDHEYEV
jgi:hypothetical protein